MEESNSLLDDFLAIAEAISDNEENSSNIQENKIKKTISKDNEDEVFLEKISDFSKNKPTSASGGLSKRIDKTLTKQKKKISTVHKGDTDSSDDEQNRDSHNTKYNDYGRDVKHLLEDRPTSSYMAPSSTWSKKRVAPSNSALKPKQSTLNFQKSEIYTDPFFGIRISKPLIPSAVLQERMCDRAAVSMAKVKEFIRRENNVQDWVISGAIVSKSPVKTSQKGTQFIIWTLSDLKDDLKTVAVFLFGSAYKNLWKTAVGTVLGILNPAIMDQREGSKDQASLSVDNVQKVMVFGHAKDYGVCKSKKKDGEQCSAFVNTNQSEYCTYHIRQEYQKLSKRSELQANFAGRGLTALRNKVLGKNEVFYAGKSYMAIPAKKNTKQMQRDNNLMRSLSGLNRTGVTTSEGVQNGKKKMAQSLDVSRAQRIRDLQLLQKLNKEKRPVDSPTAIQKIDKALNIDKALLHAEDILKDMEKLESVQQTRLLDNFAPKTDNTLVENIIVPKEPNVNEFDFLNTEPSTSMPRLAKNAVKNSEEAQTPTTSNRLMKSCVDKSENAQTPRILDFNTEPSTSAQRSPRIATPKSNKKLNKSVESVDGNVTPKKLNGIKLSSPQPILSTPNRKQSKNVLNTSLSTKNLPKLCKENANDNKSMANETVASERFNLEEYSDLLSKSKFFKNLGTPKISGSMQIDLSTVSKTPTLRIDKAKLSALKYIQKNGHIKKEVQEAPKKKGVKRFLETTDEDFQEKKAKTADSSFTSQRFKQIMALSSKHTTLLEEADREKEEKYFKKLEIREKMEEKMMTIFKADCKAVRCLTCKYTSFSASDKCKEERHVLKVFDTVKRFFKCGKCGYRTVSLDIIPLISCSNCGGSKWERTTMMREKTVHVGETLSIRGMEEKYIGAVNTGGNINLLVPDE